jgi:hypothetical protein
MTRYFSRPLRFAAIALIASSTAIFSASAQDTIQQAMSPDEFRAAGLDKLSPKELSNLNKWLRSDRAATASAAETQATKKMDFRVSRIDGYFPGLSGGTIIKLQDGSKWKQANSGDTYRGPGGENLACVVIKAGLFGYRMRIEGTPDFYVDQVK